MFFLAQTGLGCSLICPHVQMKVYIIYFIFSSCRSGSFMPTWISKGVSWELLGQMLRETKLRMTAKPAGPLYMFLRLSSCVFIKSLPMDVLHLPSRSLSLLASLLLWLFSPSCLYLFSLVSFVPISTSVTILPLSTTQQNDFHHIKEFFSILRRQTLLPLLFSFLFFQGLCAEFVFWYNHYFFPLPHQHGAAYWFRCFPVS